MRAKLSSRSRSLVLRDLEREWGNLLLVAKIVREVRSSRRKFRDLAAPMVVLSNRVSLVLASAKPIPSVWHLVSQSTSLVLMLCKLPIQGEASKPTIMKSLNVFLSAAPSLKHRINIKNQHKRLTGMSINSLTCWIISHSANLVINHKAINSKISTATWDLHNNNSNSKRKIPMQSSLRISNSSRCLNHR